MKGEREALCGHPDCKTRAKVGLDTRPRVHAAAPRYGLHYPDVYMSHPFVFGGGNATKA